MLIPQLIEEKVMCSIRQAVGGDNNSVAYVGIWQPTAPGVLKGLESDPSKRATIELKTSTATQDVASVSTASYSIEITLLVRIELDCEGGELLCFTEPIEHLLHSWMLANYQHPLNDLNVDGFEADGASVSGGMPAINVAESLASVKWTLTISGTFVPVKTNQ